MMPTIPLLSPRFETLEDAMLYQKCLTNGETFPSSKWIIPFVKLPNGDIVTSHKYKDARYEMGYLTMPQDLLRSKTEDLPEK